MITPAGVIDARYLGLGHLKEGAIAGGRIAAPRAPIQRDALACTSSSVMLTTGAARRRLVLKNIHRLLVLPLLALAACTSNTDREEAASTEAQLTTLTAQQCATPATTTVPMKDSAGQPIEGTARTTLNGCVVGRTGETGTDLVARAATILGNSTKLGTVTNAQGERLFAAFTPGPTTGTLSTGLVQEADATLNADYSPKTRFRITRKSNPDGSYTLSIANITAVNVSVGLFSIDVVQPGNFTFTATLKPETNGATVVGASDIQLDYAPERAEELSKLVRDVFTWLTKELAN